MSKQDMARENKETEGSPQIRGRIRKPAAPGRAAAA